MESLTDQLVTLTLENPDFEKCLSKFSKQVEKVVAMKNVESKKKHLYAFGTEATQKSHGKKKTGQRINVQVTALSRRKYKSYGRSVAHRGRRPARSQLYVSDDSESVLHSLPQPTPKKRKLKHSLKDAIASNVAGSKKH